MLRTLSREDLPVRHHAEQRGFELRLPMTVEGPDAIGSYFREETVLSRMSHIGALFTLSSQVSLGTRLKLAIDLPPKLSLGQDLKLIVKGTIAYIEPAGREETPRQISLRLENRYSIRPESS